MEHSKLLMFPFSTLSGNISDVTEVEKRVSETPIHARFSVSINHES